MSCNDKKERIILPLLDTIARDCIECGECSRDCGYLQRYGTPKEQAVRAKDHLLNLRQTFECSLCRLCTEVCPIDLDPAAMFFSLRKVAVDRRKGEFKQHRILTNYERRGNSPLFSWYGLPGNCTTVFFPGCALPGTRPGRIIDLYRELLRYIPSLGIVLDCCTKPSHDLGRQDYFQQQFDRLHQALQEQGISKVIVACPNCFRMFAAYGKGLEVSTVYEALAETFIFRQKIKGLVTVHDPCGLRDQGKIHNAVRRLIINSGLTIEEMPHSRNKTLCCGEGGGAGYINKELSDNWGKLRRSEAGNKRIIAYCAGCTGYLGQITPTSHLVDLLFEPEKTLLGQEKVAKSPVTYLNRIILKKKLKLLVPK